MRVILATTAIIAIAGCAALLDDSDAKRLSLPGPAYACAAYLMGVDAPGPVPTVAYHDTFWQTDEHGSDWLKGQYIPETNTVHVRVNYRLHETLTHEMVHAVQHQLGEQYGEAEAQKHSRWVGDCWKFGGI